MSAGTTADAVLVGVDGGGSGVRAGRVTCVAEGELRLVGEVATRDVSPGTAAHEWIELAADAVAEVVGGLGPVRYGMGMPGRKTDDGRGIAHALHGPVDPRFLERVETELARRGVELAAPCPRLLDDGVLGVAGELYGVDGALRGVRHGYFVGGGTGLAEAFVLGGRPVAFDAAPRPLVRAWRLADGERTFEERLSVRGVNAGYRRAGGEHGTPEEGAAAGEEAAGRVLVRAVWDLVRLVWLREQALDVRFERVVVSQRLARVLAHPGVRPLFDETLANVAVRGGDGGLVRRVVLSTDPWSAVVGAAAFALAPDGAL